MKIFKKSLKPISFILALACLISGMIFPQTFSVSGETASATTNSIYPSDVLSETNFSQYFNILGSGITVTHQTDGSVLLKMGKDVANAGQHGIVSKAPIASDNYTVSFDMKPTIVSGGTGSALVCVKSNANITEYLGTLWFAPSSGTINTYWKPAESSLGVGQVGPVKDDVNNTTSITYSDWVHVEYTVTPKKLVLTTTTDSVTQVRSMDYACGNYDFKDASGNSTLDNHLAFIAQHASNSYYVKNLQVTDDTPKQTEVFPQNVTSRGVFEQYFTTLSGSYTYQTDGSVLVQPGAYSVGKGIVSKMPVDADEYFVEFDMKVCGTAPTPIFAYKGDSGLKTNVMGALWVCSTTGSGNKVALAHHRKVVAGSYGHVNNPVTEYPVRPTDAQGNDDWMHVLIHVTETDVTITYEKVGGTYTYSANFAAQGFATGALDNYIGIMAADATTQYYLNNLQVTKANPTGLFQDDVFDDVYQFRTDFNATGSASVNAGVVTYNGNGTTVISRIPVSQNGYTISCDVKASVASEYGHDGPAIVVKADSNGNNGIAYRLVSTAATSHRLYANWDDTTKTGNFDGQSAQPLLQNLESLDQWIHFVAEVTDTNCKITCTFPSGQSYTYTSYFATMTNHSAELQNYVGFGGFGKAYDIKNFQVTTAETIQNNIAGSKNGYTFAGYFEDGDFAEPMKADSTSATAYAKYVDPEILAVKAQARSGQDKAGDDLGNAIRFVTTVDTLDYELVGFKITIGGQSVEKTTTTVYKELYAGGSMVSPALFSSDSTYFAAYTIKNIPEADVDTEITVQPFWETVNGTKVYGTAKTYCYSQLPLGSN